MAVQCEDKTVEMTDGKHPDGLLTPSEAAAYLAQKWDRPFTARDLKNLRYSRHLTPDVDYERFSLWSIETLDSIAESPRLRPELHGKPGKPRPQKRKDAE